MTNLCKVGDITQTWDRIRPKYNPDSEITHGYLLQNRHSKLCLDISQHDDQKGMHSIVDFVTVYRIDSIYTSS